MLVTRSLWSKMCKSILSVASSALSSVFACGGENALLARWYHSNVKSRPGWWALPPNTTSASRCARLTGRKTSDAIRLQPLWTTVYSNKRDSPTNDTPPPLKGAGIYIYILNASHMCSGGWSSVKVRAKTQFPVPQLLLFLASKIKYVQCPKVCRHLFPPRANILI